jgi:hypothetical protein
MSNDSKPETKPLTEHVETKPASQTRGSMMQKGGFAGVTLGPIQQLPNAIQAMTPAAPPAATEPAMPKTGDSGGSASSGEQ